MQPVRCANGMPVLDRIEMDVIDVASQIIDAIDQQAAGTIREVHCKEVGSSASRGSAITHVAIIGYPRWGSQAHPNLRWPSSFAPKRPLVQSRPLATV